MAGGRPTLYKEDYCEQLIEHMTQGFSFESFAGFIGVCKDTLNEWAKVHEQFSAAKKIAFEKSRFAWEKIGIDIAKTNDGNSTSFIFNMKNRFPEEWRDKIEREDTVKLAVQWNEQKTYEAQPKADQSY